MDRTTRSATQQKRLVMQGNISPMPLTLQNLSPTIERRFWKKVIRTDGCWLWTAKSLPKGYGLIRAGRKDEPWILAHRVSYAIEYGSVPALMHVLHVCDNPRCVNPAHLFLGHQSDNNADMRRKGRASGGSSPKNQYARRLSEEDTERVRQIYWQGKATQVQLAKMFHVGSRTVRRIVHRELNCYQ